MRTLMAMTTRLWRVSSARGGQRNIRPSTRPPPGLARHDHRRRLDSHRQPHHECGGRLHYPVEVVSYHHAPDPSVEPTRLVARLQRADLLCRMSALNQGCLPNLLMSNLGRVPADTLAHAAIEPTLSLDRSSIWERSGWFRRYPAQACGFQPVLTNGTKSPCRRQIHGLTEP
jgi:hypothetical protein